jgi:hypothetical protein
LICRITVVEKPVHAAFGPHQHNVFGASQRFPQLLIECALPKVIHVQKYFQSHGFKADFEKLGKVAAAFAAVRDEDVAGRRLRVGILVQSYNLLQFLSIGCNSLLQKVLFLQPLRHVKKKILKK